MTTSPSRSSTHRRIVWGVRAFLILAFAVAGVAKLAGAPQMIQVFEAIGIGQWFRYLTGAVEVIGALLLLKPATGFLGGLALAMTMVCGAATHLLLIGGNPVPAMILAALSAFVAWQLRPLSRLSAAS
ncbi:DoxX family protein [Pseudomonas protegens]|uniref:DoxX family protein n=1 Tax=Pseudomonas TaxID=286 RepID=UPI001576EFFF|nr:MULTISPECIES: DoxX family protein [Pseudomonas]MBB1612491.1 DoxX family protein [Pseudomonas sp. UMC65]MBB1622739.1 DoxX family protein [Pseudomonas sp. UME65]NTZ73205.1 DoxX family protein [Pseudomonas protegens]UCZ85575.1 DoxX family protein [Pseudomonas sp. L5B5]